MVKCIVSNGALLVDCLYLEGPTGRSNCGNTSMVCVLAKRVAVTTADYWCTIYTRMTCTVDMTGGFQTCKKHAAN